MNQVMENIFSRRSVRSYLDKAVPKEALDEIIRAGNAAPSGANTQDWRFVVIRDKSVRQKFVKLAIPRVEKWLEKYANESFKERRRNIAAQTPRLSERRLSAAAAQKRTRGKNGVAPDHAVFLKSILSSDLALSRTFFLPAGRFFPARLM